MSTQGHPQPRGPGGDTGQGHRAETRDGAAGVSARRKKRSLTAALNTGHGKRILGSPVGFWGLSRQLQGMFVSPSFYSSLPLSFLPFFPSFLLSFSFFPPSLLLASFVPSFLPSLSFSVLLFFPSFFPSFLPFSLLFSLLPSFLLPLLLSSFSLPPSLLSLLYSCSVTIY